MQTSLTNNSCIGIQEYLDANTHRNCMRKRRRLTKGCCHKLSVILPAGSRTAKQNSTSSTCLLRALPCNLESPWLRYLSYFLLREILFIWIIHYGRFNLLTRLWNILTSFFVGNDGLATSKRRINALNRSVSWPNDHFSGREHEDRTSSETYSLYSTGHAS